MDCAIVKRIENTILRSAKSNQQIKSMIDAVDNVNVNCNGKTLARIILEDGNLPLLKYLVNEKKAKLEKSDIVYGYTFSDGFVVKFLVDQGIKIPERDYLFIISIRKDYPTMIRYISKRQPAPMKVAKNILRNKDKKLANLVINKTYMNSLNNKDRKTLETGFIRMKKIPPGTKAVSSVLLKKNRKILTRLLGNKQLTKHYLTMKGLPENLVNKITSKI